MSESSHHDDMPPEKEERGKEAPPEKKKKKHGSEAKGKDPKTDGVAPSSSLRFHNTCLSPGDLKRRCRKLKDPLVTLEIKYCYVDYVKKKTHEANVQRELLEILEEHPKLERVKFGGLFPRNEVDVAAILNAMRNCRVLQQVEMTAPDDKRVNFGFEWTRVLRANPLLQRLTLESFDLSDGKISVLNMVAALKAAKGVREVSFAGCRITDEGLWILIQGLQYMKRIRKLRLPRCSTLSVVSLLTFASMININTELQLLDLTGNEKIFAVQMSSNLDPEAAAKKTGQRNGAVRTFMQSLDANSTLVELRLAYCGIDDKVFEMLLEALEGDQHRKLASVNLDFNNITRQVGLQSLTDHLPQLKLAKLSLLGLQNRHGEPDERGWTSKRLHAFLHALESNTDLVCLHLDNVKQDDRIDELLERNEQEALARRAEKQRSLAKYAVSRNSKTTPDSALKRM